VKRASLLDRFMKRLDGRRPLSAWAFFAIALSFIALASIVTVPDALFAVDVPRGEPQPMSRKVAQAAGGAKAKKAAAAADMVVTPEREAAVLKFVQQNHPELSTLLESLKTKNEKEYQRAIRDLFRVTERLAQFHGRDNERYDVELRLWQAQSRLDLLAARLKMSDSDELRAQVRQSLEEVFSMRQALLRLERLRAADRVQKLDEQIATLDKSRDEFLDRQMQMLTSRSSKKEAPNKKDSSRKEASKKESQRKESPKKEASTKDAATKDAVTKDAKAKPSTTSDGKK